MHTIQDKNKSKEELIRELEERAKELNCLIEISSLVEKPDATLESILIGIVKLIIPSWQYPEITAARISLGEKIFSTENFRITPWKLCTSYKVHGKKTGFIEIYYLNEKPEADDGPFLQEEKRLLSAIAALVGRIVERKQAALELRENKNMLSQIIYANSIPTFVIDSSHKVTHWNTACENLTNIPADQIIGTNMQWKAFYKEPKPVMADIMLDNPSEDALLKLYSSKARHSETIAGACEAEDFFPDLGENGKWLFFTASPLRNEKGLITGAIETLQDITDRKKAEESLRAEVAQLEQTLKERYHFESIIGKSKKMQEIYTLLENLADTDTTVLITGASGTGKELVARAIHYSGSRSKRPMITINCSALSENLLESELFGHVKGAFTGAIKDKKGRFELADKGTIFLDEIGDISSRIQLKLLRVLQEKEFERVGDSEPHKIDVRVITATNRNLKQKVQSGEFREDLYYRLKVIEVSIPSLNQRPEDIPLLTTHFFNLFRKRFKKDIKTLDKKIFSLFIQYPWPGNVRELEHAMEHAFIMCHGNRIKPEHLPEEIQQNRIQLRESATKTKPLKGKQELEEALQRTGGNKAKTARLLGISRPTLYQLIKKHRVKIPG